MPGQPLYNESYAPPPAAVKYNGSYAPPPASVQSPPPSNHGRSIPVGLIVTLSIGGTLLAVVLLQVAIHYLKKWCRARQRQTERNDEENQSSTQRTAVPPPHSEPPPPPLPTSSSSNPEGEKDEIVVAEDTCGMDSRQGPRAASTSNQEGNDEEDQRSTQNVQLTVVPSPHSEPPPSPLPISSSLNPEGEKGEILKVEDTCGTDSMQVPRAASTSVQEGKKDEQVVLEVAGGVDSVQGLQASLQIIKYSDLEVLQELGCGAFGTVNLGKWRGTDVAIKRMHDCSVGDTSEQARKRYEEFWNEVGKLAVLRHPKVVAFYGVVLDGPGGSVATVTEYVAGGSLRRALQVKRKLFDETRRILVAIDIANSMQYLHEKNIVHFDLKSDNLLLDLRNPRRPVCKVCDLGLSKERVRTLVSGTVRGTLAWMAPELLGSSDVSEKVDVYSFGIVMWELLTGKLPYGDLSDGEIWGGIALNNLRPEVPESCDPGWRSLMEECWSKDPLVRPGFSTIASRLSALASSTATG